MLLSNQNHYIKTILEFKKLYNFGMERIIFQWQYNKRRFNGNTLDKYSNILIESKLKYLKFVENFCFKTNKITKINHSVFAL